MTEFTNSIGIKSTGENINWKYLNEERIDDPIITCLMKEAKMLYIELKKESIIENNELFKTYLESYNKYLKDNKSKYEFSIPKKIEEKEKGKKKIVVTKKEILLKQIKNENLQKDIKSFIDTLIINTNHYPVQNKKNIESFFIILNWAIYLIVNKKKNIDMNIKINCAISLYRAIEESKDIFIGDFMNEITIILNELEKTIISKDIFDYLDVISNNLLLIIDSFWDIIKPKSISLYKEQKEIISLVTSNLNEKKLIFYEMPPANGKTVLSTILAKVISHKNNENLKNIPGYKRKILLYICYNTIVRNEVAKLCITHSLDVKYWLAINKMDKDDGKIKTFLRPYKNCYPDWNKKQRTTKEQEEYEAKKAKYRFSENIYEQWNFYLEETRPLSEQHKKIKDIFNADNFPEMIISDLDSAYTLLTKFPDNFITYFDEAFASSGLLITAKLMHSLGHTVLVSATLAKPEEIPSVINDFKIRHNHIKDDYLHIIKSTKQHISCTIIDDNGNIFIPHNKYETIEELTEFNKIINEPLIKRSYSPEIVFYISKKIENHLPNNLKFKNVFLYTGMINHDSLREYALNIVDYVIKTNNIEIFNLMKEIKIKKINDMNIESIFTKSAIYYQNNKTLHVSSSDNFNRHIENISKDFLEGSPKISDIVTLYNRECKKITDEIENVKKNGDKDSEYEICRLLKELDSIKLKWPAEFILNSRTHANKFGNLDLLTTPSTEIFAKKTELDILDQTRTKLLFSGIGIYSPETFFNEEMDFFLRKKDSFKFIISSPSIVYGTNISLSVIDIDSSFYNNSTKNILYQLIGRAGRKGKSHSATIIFRDNRMLDIITKKENSNVEAYQIENNFNLL